MEDVRLGILRLTCRQRLYSIGRMFKLNTCQCLATAKSNGVDLRIAAAIIDGTMTRRYSIGSLYSPPA